jgi:hypothetical protein
MSELLPCPFCGCPDIDVGPDETGSGGQWVPPIHVGCRNCHAEQISDYEEDARALWNRRAEQSPAVGWISVKDRLPDEFETVYLTFSTTHGYQTTMYKTHGWGGRGLWGTTDPYFTSESLGITHWMTIRAAPTQERPHDAG